MTTRSGRTGPHDCACASTRPGRPRGYRPALPVETFHAQPTILDVEGAHKRLDVGEVLMHGPHAAVIGARCVQRDHLQRGEAGAQCAAMARAQARPTGGMGSWRGPPHGTSAAAAPTAQAAFSAPTACSTAGEPASPKYTGKSSFLPSCARGQAGGKEQGGQMVPLPTGHVQDVEP